MRECRYHIYLTEIINIMPERNRIRLVSLNPILLVFLGFISGLPLFSQDILTQIRERLSFVYGGDAEALEAAVQEQVSAKLYMESVRQDSLRARAVRMYPEDYVQQQHYYRKLTRKSYGRR